MLTVQEARKRLAKFSLTDKKPLLVLARGTNRHLNSVTISKIVEEYPHLSLAIMEQNLQPAIDRVRAKIEEDQAALDALLALQSSTDRKSVVSGTSVYVRLDLGGARIIKKKKK